MKIRKYNNNLTKIKIFIVFIVFYYHLADASKKENAQKSP